MVHLRPGMIVCRNELPATRHSIPALRGPRHGPDLVLSLQTWFIGVPQPLIVVQMQWPGAFGMNHAATFCCRVLCFSECYRWGCGGWTGHSGGVLSLLVLFGNFLQPSGLSARKEYSKCTGTPCSRYGKVTIYHFPWWNPFLMVSGIQYIPYHNIERTYVRNDNYSYVSIIDHLSRLFN